jgi:hypothetical protein
MENEKPKFSRKPNHEFRAQISNDKKYWIFKNIETWIIPVNYLDTIFENKVQSIETQGELPLEESNGLDG